MKFASISQREHFVADWPPAFQQKTQALKQCFYVPKAWNRQGSFYTCNTLYNTSWSRNPTNHVSVILLSREFIIGHIDRNSHGRRGRDKET